MIYLSVQDWVCIHFLLHLTSSLQLVIFIFLSFFSPHISSNIWRFGPRSSMFLVHVSDLAYPHPNLYCTSLCSLTHRPYFLGQYFLLFSSVFIVSTTSSNVGRSCLHTFSIVCVLGPLSWFCSYDQSLLLSSVLFWYQFFLDPCFFCTSTFLQHVALSDLTLMVSFWCFSTTALQVWWLRFLRFT